MISRLIDYRVLIVDADEKMARVLKQTLRKMGFSDIHLTKDGKDAINLLQTINFDFVITEWDTKQMNGLEMLKFIRRNPQSPNPTIPVIMLTGRTEVADVLLARNYGVNEYMIKPFTAQSIYKRLEKIFESPRDFVVSENFVGPDRRTIENDNKPTKERRKLNKRDFNKKINPKEIKKALSAENKEPKIWPPDFSLKVKLGKNVTLGNLITKGVLSNAQKAIDAITDDSLLWIRENIDELKIFYNDLTSIPNAEKTIKNISDTALIIKSRSGTFGYNRAKEIAYELYMFSKNVLNPENKKHLLVVKKHIEVLQVILGHQLKGNAGESGAQIADELKKLVKKYA
ncbi:MAG: response regulator [Rickettsiales bacterium]